MTVRGRRALREPRGCSSCRTLMTDLLSSTPEGPAMRGGGTGWREDSSWSSAVWIMWTTGASARGTRIRAGDDDVDGLGTMTGGVWGEDTNHQAVLALHTACTGPSAG